MVLGDRRRTRDAEREPRESTTYVPREHRETRDSWANQTTRETLDRVSDNVKSLELALKLCTETLVSLQRRNGEEGSPADGTVVDVSETKLQRNDTVNVTVRVVFMKIGDIDTLKEQYEADLFIHIAWQEPAFDGLSEKDVKDSMFESCWNPKLYIENAAEPKEESWYSLEFDDRGKATVIEKRRCKGVFLESLELKHFPFDTQDLSVTLTTERSEIELKLVEEPKKLSSINTQSFVDAQEWDLHSHVESERTWTTKEFSGSQYRCPAVVFTCRAARRPGFFLYNILLIMFFISTLAFNTFAVKMDLTQNRLQLSFTLVLTSVAFKFVVNQSLPKISYLTYLFFISTLAFNTFAVDGTLTQNRLQLSFTLVLTSVAFKFVVNQSLPKISYLTYLDKYILASMGILCIVCFWHALVSILIKHLDNDLVESYDLYSLLTIGIIYILFHIAFFLNIYLDAGKRRRLMYQKDIEYKEARDRLDKVKVKSISPDRKQKAGDRKSAETSLNGGVSGLAAMQGIQGLSGARQQQQQQHTTSLPRTPARQANTPPPRVAASSINETPIVNPGGLSTSKLLAAEFMTGTKYGYVNDNGSFQMDYRT